MGCGVGAAEELLQAASAVTAPANARNRYEITVDPSKGEWTRDMFA